MIRVFLLILIMMISVAFAQTEETPQAFKVAEFERATNGYVKMQMDNFYTELNNNPTAQGYIINFGTDREILIRERQIRNAINFRRFDASRITIVRGGFRGIVKTEFWVVPAGADDPKIESSSKKVDEFGAVAGGELKARLDNYFIQLANDATAKGFIVNSGSTSRITARENQIKTYIALRKFDLSRITLIKDGTGNTIKTEFWIDSPKTEE